MESFPCSVIALPEKSIDVALHLSGKSHSTNLTSNYGPWTSGFFVKVLLNITIIYYFIGGSLPSLLFFFPLSPFLPFFLQHLAVEHRMPSNVQHSSCLSFLSPGLQKCSIMLSNDQQNRKRQQGLGT